MKNLVFFGSLRSKRLLHAVLERNIDDLKFNKGIIHNCILLRVKNENFPFARFTNNLTDKSECLYVNGLRYSDFEKILFYESIEYELKNIEIIVNKKIIKSNFFSLKLDHSTNELWSYESWLKKHEKLSIKAAIKWMSLFDQYKDQPGIAEKYWQKMLNQAKDEI
mgnify:CR=1 FL=1|tara:strand:+ start:310 stop:804 length:495 start_codon:yes stop_codon:yes gene_type:complete